MNNLFFPKKVIRKGFQILNDYIKLEKIQIFRKRLKKMGNNRSKLALLVTLAGGSVLGYSETTVEAGNGIDSAHKAGQMYNPIKDATDAVFNVYRAINNTPAKKCERLEANHRRINASQKSNPPTLEQSQQGRQCIELGVQPDGVTPYNS